MNADPHKVFFTSDLHFGHKNVIKYSRRPFKDVDHMDEELIARWNAKVPTDGKVYFLGDLSFRKPERTLRIVNRLHGDIRFIRGNHDHVKGDLARRFSWIKDYHETRSPDGRKLILCHFPMVTWNGASRGSWMLHGHCHGNLKVTPTTRMDVGVDTHPNHEPYSWSEVRSILSKREYNKVDHHGADRKEA